MKIISIVLASLTFLLSACSQQPDKPIVLATNFWPGYEFLYLAQEKGFFAEAGANVELKHLSSLSDGQRAYLHGHVDGMASTLIEAVQVMSLGARPLKIVMVADYSDGGDVIMADASIPDMASLKGKTVGCEVTSLGIYFLQKALAKSGLSLSDVKVVNIEQAEGEQALLDGRIDAFVTYPPVSVAIGKHEQFKQIFDSSLIPGDIIDVVSLSEEAIRKNPGIVDKLREAWAMALKFTEENPEEAYPILAKRERISPEEFKEVLADLHVLSREEQEVLFSQPERLRASVSDVCSSLVHVKSIEADCEKFPDIVYQP